MMYFIGTDNEMRHLQLQLTFGENSMDVSSLPEFGSPAYVKGYPLRKTIGGAFALNPSATKYYIAEANGETVYQDDKGIVCSACKIIGVVPDEIILEYEKLKNKSWKAYEVILDDHYKYVKEVSERLSKIALV